MKKIKNVANMNYLWLLLGSYFIVVLFNLLRFSTEALFLKLGEVGIVGTIIGVVISYPFLWFMLLQLKWHLNKAVGYIRQLYII